MSPPKEGGHLQEPGTINDPGETSLHGGMIPLGRPKEGEIERLLTP